MKINRFLSVFNFKRADRIGFLTLTTIIAILFIIDTIIISSTRPQKKLDTQFLKQIDNFEKSLTKTNNRLYINKLDSFIIARYDTIKLFKFDPNTATKTDFKKLGLTNKQIRTILRYRKHGGKFVIKSDFQHIYGIREKQYEILKPYIALPDKETDRKSETYTQPQNNSASNQHIKQKQNRTIEAVKINSADTAAFKQLPGIGTKLSARIIKYRKKLGGFVSVEQIGEVYGIKPTVFERIKPFLILDQAKIRKININFAEFRDLIKHPYLDKKSVIAILNYRQKNGMFNSVDELKTKKILSAETFNKIKPYLTTGE